MVMIVKTVIVFPLFKLHLNRFKRGRHQDVAWIIPVDRICRWVISNLVAGVFARSWWLSLSYVFVRRCIWSNHFEWHRAKVLQMDGKKKQTVKFCIIRIEMNNDFFFLLVFILLSICVGEIGNCCVAWDAKKFSWKWEIEKKREFWELKMLGFRYKHKHTQARWITTIILDWYIFEKQR